MDKPLPRPDGNLIRHGIHNTPGMTIRKLATLVDLSEARVRQYINGYTSAGRGQYVLVEPPPDRLAKIAVALDLSERQLRNAGRSDAADALAELNADAEAQADESVSTGTDDDPEFEFLTRVREDLTDEEMDQLMTEARPYLEMLVRDIKNRNRQA